MIRSFCRGVEPVCRRSPRRCAPTPPIDMRRRIRRQIHSLRRLSSPESFSDAHGVVRHRARDPCGREAAALTSDQDGERFRDVRVHQGAPGGSRRRGLRAARLTCGTFVWRSTKYPVHPGWNRLRGLGKSVRAHRAYGRSCGGDSRPGGARPHCRPTLLTAPLLPPLARGGAVSSLHPQAPADSPRQHPSPYSRCALERR